MTFLKLLTNSVLLFTVPVLAVSPQAENPVINAPDIPVANNITRCNDLLFSYDDVLSLLERIEDSSIEEFYTVEELDGLNQFIALLAKQGILPGDLAQEFAINQDIEDLLTPNIDPFAFSYFLEGTYTTVPGIFKDNHDALLCRSWIKKKWDQTRTFVKEHKKEILIGAIIVVAVAATVVAVVVASSAGAAAVGTAEVVGAAIASSTATQFKQAGQLQEAVSSRLDTLVSRSESEVLKAALDHNKHVKMVRDYLDKPAKEIQKGIYSYEKQIAIHKDKIANPIKHYPDWDKLDPRRREALINKKWPAEIKGYEEQRGILQSILNERITHEL